MIPPVLHAPPAVRFPSKPGRRLRVFSRLPGAASALLLAAWWWQGAHRWPVPALALAVCAWMLAAAMARRAEQVHPRGWLRWDGHAWHWQPVHLDGQPAADEVLLEQPPESVWDGQSFVWAALVPRGGRRIWCLLDREADPQRWSDLRRALYFRPKSGVTPDAAATGPGPRASPT